MMKNRTNLSERNREKEGRRCHICTGCGVCPGVSPSREDAGQLHVLDEDFAQGKRAGIPGGRRLAAADVGTTTIAMLLYGEDGTVTDRFAAVNPQSAFGTDVISRIRAAENYAIAEELKRQVRGVLKQGLLRFQRKLAPGEELELVLAANMTMTCLLLGYDTSELGYAPFRAPCLHSVKTELEGISCFVLPGMSAFVGGDITAGVYACGMAESEKLTLLIDLGTNGELVLGNAKRRIACATAAGPAFEGGAGRGIWGADMVSLLAKLRERELLDETGLLAEPYFCTGIRIGNVLITQEEIRRFQLAKAAVAAGADILLEKYGITVDEVDRVVLAGGFGYYLKPDAAAEIGLLRAELAAKAVSGGNTALTGAMLVGRLLCGGMEPESAGRLLEGIAAGTEVINLAEEPGFEEQYISKMSLAVSGRV